MDPLTEIARTLKKLETAKTLEQTRERCRELLDSKSGVLLVKEWTRQYYLSGEFSDGRPSYVVSGTGVSQSFGSEEDAVKFFRAPHESTVVHVVGIGGASGGPASSWRQ